MGYRRQSCEQTRVPDASGKASGDTNPAQSQFKINIHPDACHSIAL